MGNHYTRIVRVYAKTQERKIDKEAICKSIIDTAYMEHELQVFENREEDCLDLKWTSNRAGGELKLNKEEFDIWEIRGGDYNNIYLNQELIGGKEDRGFIFFGFDTIIIKGATNKMDDFLKDFYLTENRNNWKKDVQSENEIRISGHGLYSTGIRYDLGEYDVNNQDSIRTLGKEEFLKLNGENNSTYGCLMNSQVVSNLERALDNFEHAERNWDDELINIYPNLKSLEFLWKGRSVNKITKVEKSIPPTT